MSVSASNHKRLYNRAYWARIYTFGDRQLVDSKKCRTGVCSKCGKRVGDKYRGWRNKLLTAKQTQLHHEFYLVICPWFGRVELCVACHDKLHWQRWHGERKHVPKEIHYCSRCGSSNSISKYWYFDDGKRLCRRCWRNTVYGPANRERINRLARAAEARRKLKRKCKI